MRDAVLSSKIFAVFRLQEEDAPVFQRYLQRTELLYRKKFTNSYHPIRRFVDKLIEKLEKSILLTISH